MRFVRNSLIILGGLAIAFAGAAYLKGVRYPPPQVIPPPAATHSGSEDTGNIVVEAEGAIFQGREGEVFTFRAFVPEPELKVLNQAGRKWDIRIANVHPEASLVSDPIGLTEQTDGLKRKVTGHDARATFGWRFPRQDHYRFAAIGDTGGGLELRWVLQRAQELGADFILHLGDFNYSPGEYVSTVEALNQARVPTFVSIGNHDFYDDWRSVHHLFRQYIGPRNASFRLGRVRFINLDTAAGFIPADAGARGRFLNGLVRDRDAADIVAFTHKPLVDPRPGEDHEVPALEYDYLQRELGRLGVKTILAGHIHIRKDFEHGGVRMFISGEGLAHADLIVDRPYARILLGQVLPDKPEVAYHWAPIDMPFEAHCSPRAWDMLREAERPDTLGRLETLCPEEP